MDHNHLSTLPAGFDRSSRALRAALIASLYAEALVLADETRGWFDARGPLGEWSDTAVSAAHRVIMACESLRLTTRLMHALAWLLTQRAIAAGEISAQQGATPQHRLGMASYCDIRDIAGLPDDAQRLILASVSLYDRVARLDAQLDLTASANDRPAHRPRVHQLQDRLRASF